jgi:SLT domain-containing protein
MAAKKEYEAVLALGAKISGSFKSAFGAARKSLDNLKKGAAALGKAFAPVWRGFQMALGGLAAFATVKIFENIFGGAEQAAKDALKRTQQLTAALTANPKLQALGTDAIKGQVLALQQVSAELGKQGVVHSDHFEQASRTLALYGMGPQTIAKILPVLGDTLVAVKGVNATVEQMDELTKGVTKAIGTGQVKALADVGIMMDKNQKKAFAAATPLQRQTKLVEILTQKYRESNAAAVDTDLGKIQRFQNMIAGFSETIGLQMIPMQAKLAEFWTKTLPEIEPIAKDVFKAISDAMGDTAKFATEIVVPAIQHLAAFFTGSEFSTSVKELGDAFNALGAAFAPLTSAFSSTGQESRTFAKIITDEITQTIKDFTGLVEGTARVAKAMGDAWNAAGGVFNTIGATIQKAFNESLQKVKDDWSKIDAFFKGLAGPISSALQTVTDAINKPFLDAIDAIKKAWDALIAAITGFKMPDIGAQIGQAWGNRPQWMGGSGGKPPGAQFGGIFTQPAIRQIAEAGVPEAVIPLERTQRSQGLLASAANAVMGSQQSASSTTNKNQVSFAPVINIAGNATSDTAQTIERSLRDIADDFLNRFNEAQSQERRLSFAT